MQMRVMGSQNTFDVFQHFFFKVEQHNVDLSRILAFL
jgi:hypothetical protein